MQTFEDWFSGLKGHEKISAIDKALMRAGWDAAALAALKYQYDMMIAA